MPLFMLTFTKEVDASVEAASREELDAAVQKLLAAGGPKDWDAEWRETVWDVPLIDGKVLGEHAKPDCGVVRGEILEYDDYLEALRGD